MNNRFWVWLLLLAVTLPLTMVPGCGDDDDEDEDPDDDDDDTDDDVGDDDTGEECDWDAYDPLIVSGKSYLSKGNDADAYGAFLDGMVVCPGEADAKLGLLLADTQWYLGWFNEWINFLLNFNPAPHAAGGGDDKSIGTVIQALIRNIMQPVNAEMFALAEDLLNNHRDVRFYLETLPMWTMDEEVVLDLGGEWDIADVRNAYAFAQFLEGLEQLLLTYDFTFNYYTYAYWPKPNPDHGLMGIVHTYSGLFLALLADEAYPNFLMMFDGGDMNLALSGMQSGFACLSMTEAFEEMLDEIDPQEDDVTGYEDENGNGRWDPDENYKVPYLGILNEELNIMFQRLLVMTEHLGVALLDRSPADRRPDKPDWFMLSDLNVILELLDMLEMDLRMPPIPVPVGRWFYLSNEEGFRNLAGAGAQFLYDWSAPEEGGAL